MKRVILILFVGIIATLSAEMIYVVNSGSSTLSRIDLDEGIVDNTFAVLGNMANRVALTEEKAYIVNSGDNNIQIINLSDGSTEGNIYLGSSVNPYDIILVDNFAYVTGGLDNHLYKVDLVSETVAGSIEVGGNPAGIAALNGKLYVGNTDYASGYSNCSVSVVDLTQFQVEATIATEPNPQYLVVSGDMIHVICGGNWVDVMGKAQIIDSVNNTIVATLDLGGNPGSAVVFNNRIYVGDSMNAGIYAYDINDYNIIYGQGNLFTPGGSSLCSNDEMFGSLGGEWGQNFEIRLYDSQENLVSQYTTGLYGTDVKFGVSSTGSDEDEIAHPTAYATNYPNPFNPSDGGRGPETTIKFHCSNIDNTPEVMIYNSRGQLVRIVESNNISDNIFTAVWNGNNASGKGCASGIYFYKIDTSDGILVNKMILMR